MAIILLFTPMLPSAEYNGAKKKQKRLSRKLVCGSWDIPKEKYNSSPKRPIYATSSHHAPYTLHPTPYTIRTSQKGISPYGQAMDSISIRKDNNGFGNEPHSGPQ
jgi:hypothetical protein